jgi:hypothetical protein
MNARRASAYTNVIRLLAELGPAVGPADQDAIREVVDTRLFAPAPRGFTETALRRAERVLDRLVEEGRLSPWAADQLAHDIEACGPIASPEPARR